MGVLRELNEEDALKELMHQKSSQTQTQTQTMETLPEATSKYPTTI